MYMGSIAYSARGPPDWQLKHVEVQMIQVRALPEVRGHAGSARLSHAARAGAVPLLYAGPVLPGACNQCLSMVFCFDEILDNRSKKTEQRHRTAE